MFKPLICKYRIHAHSLKIESGQYFNIDRHERICDLCIEDQYHLILKCKKYINIAPNILNLITGGEKTSAFNLVQVLSVFNIKELNNCCIVLNK